MALLGDDGRGFELARKLEACGVWRPWLGDSIYNSFVPFLSSPASWESFMRVDDSKSRAQIQLQLRVRALLFDKATVSLFLRSNFTNSSLAVSQLNPSYLQLHGDDIYFTLDGTSQDAGVASSTAKNQSKSSFSAGPRYCGSEFDSLSHRFGNEELPETWYNQFMEKYRLRRPYKLSFGDREFEKRTPEEMSAYIRVVEKHKRRLVAFPENTSNMHLNSVSAGNSLADDDVLFFPETMSMMNCVPDSALPPINKGHDSLKVEFHGVLDTLPPVTTRSPVMIERLGIRPEYLGMERGGNVHRGKNRRLLGQEHASQSSRKVISRMLVGMGFEGATEVPLEVFSQLFSCHICKLGHNLKVLADSYRKQCSAIELIKMFLHTAGYSNFGPLAELVKDSTRNVVQQTQQQIHSMQSQLQSQQQGSLRIAQQIPRQMHPQMQQMVNPQNLVFQQPQQQLRRRQAATPRPVTDMDKERLLVQVKIEQPSDLPLEGNAFNPMRTRHPQMQFQHQPFSAMSNLQPQSSNQFRQLVSPQTPQMRSPNMGIVRAPPVKVEGFQELMGGDATLKHDSEENRLTSPPRK
ncbi:hypothetical protein SLE2022_299780 [Rubroshorea leprosula]